MNRGFSLLELLVMMAIVSTLASTTTPLVSRWSERSIVLQEAKRFQRLLERAYTIALFRAQPVVITFRDHGVTLTVGDEEPLSLLTPHSKVVIKPRSDEQRELTFYPTHTTTPSTIEVIGPATTCLVILSLRGRTRRVCL